MKFFEHPYSRFVRKHISVIAFVSGFVWDMLTLTRIDLLFENVVLITYLTLAACGIVLVHAVELGRIRYPWLVSRKAWLPILVQFPIGGLFSGSVIFYTKSASFWTSWVFILLLVALFVGNELLKKRYERLVFQVAMFYFVLIAYLVLLVPIIVRSIGTFTFLLSGLASLFVISLLLQVLMRLFPDVYQKSFRALILSIGGIYLIWNVMYFTNVIPPVPLAVKEIGIYHSVVREGNGYRVRYEAQPWYTPWRTSDAVFHRFANDAAYCFSAVFAPTRFSLNLIHRWEYFDTSQGAWTDQGEIPFSIVGGRDGGYRGYTIKTSLAPGRWRCSVATQQGAVMGRVGFRVVSSTVAPVLTDAMR